MVMLLDNHAHGLRHCQHHATHVLTGIQRRNRQVTGLALDAMTVVAALTMRTIADRQLGGCELKAGVVAAERKLRRVEHEEFGLGADIVRIGNSRGVQVGLRPLRDSPRIPVVGLARLRLENVADDHQGGRGGERDHLGRRRIGHKGHVGFVDRLPAGNGRTIKHNAVSKRGLVDHRGVVGHITPLAAGVGETEVDILDSVLLDKLKHSLGGLHSGLTSSACKIALCTDA